MLYLPSLFLHGLVACLWLIALWTVGQSEYWQHIFSTLDIQLVLLIVVGLLLLTFSAIPTTWQPPKTSKQDPMRWWIHGLALGLLLLLFGTVYHQVLEAWWTYDDPHILYYVDAKGPLVGFYDPNEKYNFYTPLQTASWWLDYQLFGIEPQGFYWHHVFSMSIVIVLAYMVCNLFFAPFISTAVVSLFIVAVPTVEMVHYLMVRHYIEGLAFALLSTWLYVFAINRTCWHFALLGSVIYFLAAISKELYVPLVVALIWLPVGNLPIRIRYLLPYVFFAVLYTLIRLYMLGYSTFSTYNPVSLDNSTGWQDIVFFPVTLSNIMGWEQWWQWLPMLGVVFILMSLVVRKPMVIGLPMLTWLICVLLPLVPILWRISMLHYYLFVVGLFVALGVGLALHYLASWLKQFSWHTPLLSGFILVLLMAYLLPAQVDHMRLKRMMENWRVHGMALLYDNTPLTVVIYDYHVASSLIYLREQVLQRTEGIGWCPEVNCECVINYSGYTAKQFRNGKWHSEIITPESYLQDTQKSEFLQLQDCGYTDKALSVQITFLSPTTVRWEFGPYEDTQGIYSVFFLQPKQVSNPNLAAKESNLKEHLLKFNIAFTSKTDFRLHTIPRKGKYTFTQPLKQAWQIVVKYQSKAGWATYSPRLDFNPTQTEVFWQHEKHTLLYD